MKTYRIGFYDVKDENGLTEIVEKVCKCDANALRIVATKMQYNTIESVGLYSNRQFCHILVRYR